MDVYKSNNLTGTELSMAHSNQRCSVSYPHSAACFSFPLDPTLLKYTETFGFFASLLIEADMGLPFHADLCLRMHTSRTWQLPPC